MKSVNRSRNTVSIKPRGAEQILESIVDGLRYLGLEHHRPVITVVGLMYVDGDLEALRRCEEEIIESVRRVRKAIEEAREDLEIVIEDLGEQYEQ